MTIEKPADIPGWFMWDDQEVFDALLSAQDRAGTLIELGVYLGRSAVAIGAQRRPDERFVVVDLFGRDAGESADGRPRARVRRYRSLRREEFERNYLSVLPDLPEIVEGPSTEIVDHVSPGEARFVHIDASHLYAQVAEDLRNAAKLLSSDGVVVLDDYRAPHTPGVAAAGWEAVVSHGLVPIALTHQKMYATWGDPEPHLQVIRRLIANDRRLSEFEQDVLGHTLIRIKAEGRGKRRSGAAQAPRARGGAIRRLARQVKRRLTR